VTVCRYAHAYEVFLVLVPCEGADARRVVHPIQQPTAAAVHPSRVCALRM